MAVPETKNDLIKDINRNFSLLFRKLSELPEEKSLIKTLDGHVKNTKMTVFNLVSYLIGWGETVLSWHDKEKKGINIEFPAPGYKWNQLGLLAQKFYLDYEHIKQYQEILEKLNNNNKEILELVNSFSNDQLYGQAWYGKWTRGRMIQFNTASPYKNASNRLNAWNKQENQS